MVYVMSDLHGCFDKYSEMLRKIDFRDSDSLFILGDIVDIGPAPFKIISDAIYRCNVFPIIGEHDYKAIKMLSKMNNSKAKNDEKYMKEFMEWLRNGGTPTATEFRELSEEEQADTLEYLKEEMALYDEVNVNGRDYIMTHAGIVNFSPDKEPDEYSLKDFITGPVDYTREYYKDKIMITGHNPTFNIDENSRGKIYRTKSHIAIDCGASCGGSLGCLCLDTDTEYYI